MSELFDRGMRVRRAVLGDAYVDRSLQAASDGFAADLQQLVTEYCWGAVWDRDGLARRDRSLLNLGMLIALDKPKELATHVRGALQNGLTRDEIREVVLQAAIYCGVPAALDANRTVREAFAAFDAEVAAGSSDAPPSAA